MRLLVVVEVQPKEDAKMFMIDSQEVIARVRDIVMDNSRDDLECAYLIVDVRDAKNIELI